MSLNQFYFMIGLNPDSIKNAKAIKAQPKLDVALTIAQALDLSVEYLATGKDIDKKIDFPKWGELLDEQRVAVKQFIALDVKKDYFTYACMDITKWYDVQMRAARANHAHG